MSPQNEKIWLDSEVQPILRRFAATRETLQAVLLLIRENLESEVAFGALQHASETRECGECEGKGSINSTRCGWCKGIGRVVAE